MDWQQSINCAVEYIEKNIDKEISIGDIAKHACISPYYFQKGFAAVCGITVGEYLRKRKLSCAGNDLLAGNQKVIDVALKYGYNSPDSFAKAFLKFHGVTPSAVKRNKATTVNFAPIVIDISLKGGNLMDFKIVEKPAFTVVGYAKKFKYDTAPSEVPVFWNDYFQNGKHNVICGMYGINHDITMGGNEFEYMIADDYCAEKAAAPDVVTKTIPPHTWAVFSCKGPSAQTIQDINRRIFTEWLPSCKDYEIAEGYNIELYTDIANYPNGIMDENYYSEIWIPVTIK